jgi:hypothetical protein
MSLSQMNRGLSNVYNPFYGKHHSKETRNHWSKIRKGKILAKDKFGNKYVITKDDPRWKSGELVGHTKHVKEI